MCGNEKKVKKKQFFFSIARHFENCYDKKKPSSDDNYTTID